ncbi:MAG TPA: hypothetical protein DCE41_25970, partial [Cytophagales bacterium]|nr:hypothetical protein [Cytophagales bacterium]
MKPGSHTSRAIPPAILRIQPTVVPYLLLSILVGGWMLQGRVWWQAGHFSMQGETSLRQGVFWLLGGLLLVALFGRLLYDFLGREVVQLSPGQLIIEKKLFSITLRRQCFRTQRIKDLHARDRARWWNIFAYPDGVISFYYGQSWHHCGASLTRGQGHVWITHWLAHP